MAAQSVQCPVCNKFFISGEIETHVNLCLNNEDEISEAIPSTESNSRGCYSEEPKLKRLRTESDGYENSPARDKSGQDRKSNWKFMMGVKTRTISPTKNVKFSPKPSVASRNDRSQMSDRNSSTMINSQICAEESRNIAPSTSANDDCSVLSVHSNVPLAERMRPVTLKDYIGQEQAVGHKKLLRTLFEANKIPSMIFYGPPGCGKTTLAKIVAQQCKESHNTRFTKLSATTSGVADVKEAIKVAKNEWKLCRRTTVLFIDEIHRFNKLQQDSFLPHVEDGTIVLIGATTENPSFQVNNALLSRCRVILLEKLAPDHIITILEKAIKALGIRIQLNNNKGNDLKNEDKKTRPVAKIEEDAISLLANICDGDARAALNNLEAVVKSKITRDTEQNVGIERNIPLITVEDVKDGMLHPTLQYDRNGEEHYNCASALQKSIRGSDANGAIYWMTRMFEGGEDPLFIARRLVVTASEDIGMADSNAVQLAVSTFQACQFIGRPECALNLAHCVTYLARAPKSFESTRALLRVRKCISENQGPQPSVPLHLRNAPTKLMKDLGYGKGYKYNHTHRGPVHQEYLPKELKGVDFFA